MQRLKVLITGTSYGIGKATALKFLNEGFIVYGIDIKESTIDHKDYVHYIADVSKKEQLPELDDIDYVINNAGTISEDDALSVNTVGYINVGEKYSFNKSVKGVVNVGSISGVVGLDKPYYCSSQGGRISYTKNLAIRLGKENKTPVNLVSFGATHTTLEEKLYARDDLMEAVANESILKKWCQPNEAADWIYFVAVINKSMTGQNIVIDNGETANFNFIECRD